MVEGVGFGGGDIGCVGVTGVKAVEVEWGPVGGCWGGWERGMTMSEWKNEMIK